MESAVKSIQAYFPEQRVNILSAVMADKDYDEMVEQLKPVTAHAFTVSTGMPRALAAEAYAEIFRARKLTVTACEDADEGIRQAIRISREQGVPLICLGSLYLYNMVAEVVETLK